MAALSWLKPCFPLYVCIVAKDCLLTGQEQVCTRTTQLLDCHHAENGQIHREMAADCPIVITSMVDTSLQTRNKEASLLHTWHWVLFCLLSSMKNPLFRFWRHLMSWSDIVENVSKNKYVLPHLKISKRYINVYLLYMALQAAIKYFHMFRIGLLLTLCSKGCRLTWRRNITDLM